MQKIVRQAQVPYSAEQMFDLVNDVARYPEFLPWCERVDILSQNETECVAKVMAHKAGMRKSFTTRNILNRPASIDMQLVEGPFKRLHGAWSFEVLSPQQCKASFELSFEFNNTLAHIMLNPLFQPLANTMLESFLDRAEKIYGK